MRVAIVYNRESQRVINLFGMPNREKYGLKAIKTISDALKKGGHQVAALEGDKDLVDRLEEFMPRVVKGERPGMVFNLSYGIQGQARYTHVPGILEMIGLPYVGSGPLAHSLALDKVVSKMLFVQNDLPTADFAVLNGPDFEVPDLEFPLIVKPKNEAVSFGIQIVENETAMRDAARAIFDEFAQPVLAEQYIAGREINVGLLGNHPTETLPPAEIIFGDQGPPIYTYEDKTRSSGRDIHVECPADLDVETSQRAQDIARRAFEILGCHDCARVDMRLDSAGRLYILEVNSLPSLGEHGSYVQGAAAVGLDFTALVNRLVDVAAARYFGTPRPPEVRGKGGSVGDRLVTFLASQRDRLERDLREWAKVRSRTADPVGIHDAVAKLDLALTDLGFESVDELTDSRAAWTWSNCGSDLQGATLLVGHLDVPLESEAVAPSFRREPEWLYGEGIGCSRSPLVSLLYALRALRRVRRLRKQPLSVLYYGDEGQDCRYSAGLIQQAMSAASRVIVLRPGNIGDHVVTSRRGQRRYRVTLEGDSIRLGQSTRRPEVLPWAFEKLQACARLTSKTDRVAVATYDLRTEHRPMLLPHRVSCTLLVSYPNEDDANQLEQQVFEIFSEKGISSKVELVSSRPPMRERRGSSRLINCLVGVAEKWEIPFKRESSVWPSVAGLAPASTDVVCGMGPVARNIYTPEESVDRISLVHRTLLLAEFLAENGATEP